MGKVMSKFKFFLFFYRQRNVQVKTNPKRKKYQTKSCNMRDTRATPYRLGTCLLFTQRMMVDRDRTSIFPPSLTNDLMVVQRNYEIRQLNSIHHGRGRGRGRRSVKKCLVTPLSLSSSLMSLWIMRTMY